MPDKEMIERCAKAMFDEACPAIRYTDEDRAFYSRMAVANIKAMREPTEKMKLAGQHEDVYGPEWVWQNMIDAVINE